MSKPKITLKFLTRGYKRIVYLRPGTLEKLPQEEQDRLRKYYEVTGTQMYNIDEITARELHRSEDTFTRQAFLEELEKIYTGQKLYELYEITIANYATGLRIAGRSDLATRFETFAKKLHDQNIHDFEIMMEDLPNLYLFYKDRDKSHTKRQKIFNNEVAESQIEYFESKLEEYENDPVYNNEGRGER